MRLVLSSSARVSQVTYQTVVGLRYPELVEQTSTGWNFGRFVSEEEPLRGGFLGCPPGAHACGRRLFATRDFHADAKSSLAFAAADLALSLAGQKFSYLLRGRAIIAKDLGTLEHKPDNTKTKTTTRNRTPIKKAPRDLGLGEKVKLTRPKIFALNRSPQRKNDFPFYLPFCTPHSQAPNQSADTPGRMRHLALPRSNEGVVSSSNPTRSAFSPLSSYQHLTLFHSFM